MPEPDQLEAPSDIALRVEDEATSRGFISVPAGAELRPNDREAFLLETLWEWREMSARTGIVLGEPLRR